MSRLDFGDDPDQDVKTGVFTGVLPLRDWGNSEELC